MTPSWHEAPVALDKLDDHLKALLRLKIREFVHLSPWFKDTTVLDSMVFSSSAKNSAYLQAGSPARQALCPHRKHEPGVRRHVRLPSRAKVS